MAPTRLPQTAPVESLSPEWFTDSSSAVRAGSAPSAPASRQYTAIARHSSAIQPRPTRSTASADGPDSWATRTARASACTVSLDAGHSRVWSTVSPTAAQGSVPAASRSTSAAKAPAAR